jgi:hypothetical protein
MTKKKDDGATWNTKYGKRRVRHDPPTLNEAIDVARALADELDAQVEIAASLMGLPADKVRVELQKAAPVSSRPPTTTVAFVDKQGAPRAVIVERKPSRRISEEARRKLALSR